MPNPIYTPGYRYATRKYLGDGSTVDYEFAFDGVEPGYISRDHVVVSVMNNADRVEVVIPANQIQWMGPNQIRLPQPYADTHTIIIRRDTPKEQPLLDFNDGAILNETNLNMTSQQAVYVAAEMVDLFADMLDIFQGVNQDVINALNFALEALNIANLALLRANEAYDLALAAWNLANSKPDNFLELDDTPSTYENEAGNVVIVNPLETGLDMVPIDEVPGFRDAVETIIDDHGGGGGGEGLPLDLPVLLHQPDSRASNGIQILPGSNVSFSYTFDGDLLINSTGGGGGIVKDFSVSNWSIDPLTQFQSFWTDPTNTSDLPSDGVSGPPPYGNTGQVFIASGSDFYTGSSGMAWKVKVGSEISGGYKGSVSLGSKINILNSHYSTSIDGSGIHVDNRSVIIGAKVPSVNLASPYGNIVYISPFYEYANIDPEPSDKNHSGSVFISARHRGNYAAGEFIHSDDAPGVTVINSDVDLGGLPFAVSIQDIPSGFAGSGWSYTRKASSRVSFCGWFQRLTQDNPISGVWSVDASHELDFVAGAGEFRASGEASTSYRIFKFDITFLSQSGHCSEAKLVVRTANDGTNPKLVTILSSQVVDINGNSGSGIEFVVEGSKLHVRIPSNSLLVSDVNRVIVDRVMIGYHGL